MIEINDNNREDLIASCLMEAAKVMVKMDYMVKH